MLNDVFEKILIFLKEKPLVLLSTCILSSVLSSILIYQFVYKPNSTSPVGEPVLTAEDDADTSFQGANIFVEVSGAVLNPGVYELNNESRVIEVLKKGGGLSDKADIAWVSKNINLSKKIEDSQKIYIPFIWDTFENDDESVGQLVLHDLELSENPKEEKETLGESKPIESSATENSVLINVNTASLSELDSLSGIGPAYAQKIVDNRPYVNIEEFKAKSGVPVKTVENIKRSLSF